MNDLRDALEEAYNEDVGEENEETTPDSAVSEPLGEAEDTEAGGGEDQAEAVVGEHEPGAVGVEDGESGQPAEVSPAAPVGWDPEVWGGVPEAARAHIEKRERQVETLLRNTTQARQTQDIVNKLTQTYGAVMQAEGTSDPLEAFSTLMGTVAQLRMGNASQKAQVMANLIKHFDVDITGLDNALVGEVDPQQQQLDSVGQMIDDRMGPVNQMMQNLAQYQQGQNMQMQQGVAKEVEDFGKQAEFMPQVRSDMADLLDMATARGQTMTLQEAYDKACAFNPQVQQIMQQRLAAKQKAASSVKGSGQENAKPQNQSLHDELVAAWNSFS